MNEHLDENGQPCARHAPATLDQLLALAIIGSRMPGFHHDAASKLQSLMMSLDEISEVAEAANPELRHATDAASGALRELHQLFTANRALAKPPQRRRMALAELMTSAANRCGVKVRGDAGAIDVEIAPPSMIHAMSLLLDLAAGAAHLGRVVDLGIAVQDNLAVLTLTGSPAAAAKQPVNAGEVIALATFLIVREEGELRCSSDGERFLVKLPIAMASTSIPTL